MITIMVNKATSLRKKKQRKPTKIKPAIIFTNTIILNCCPSLKKKSANRMERTYSLIILIEVLLKGKKNPIFSMVEKDVFYSLDKIQTHRNEDCQHPKEEKPKPRSTKKTLQMLLKNFLCKTIKKPQNFIINIQYYTYM